MSQTAALNEEVDPSATGYLPETEFLTPKESRRSGGNHLRPRQGMGRRRKLAAGAAAFGGFTASVVGIGLYGDQSDSPTPLSDGANDDALLDSSTATSAVETPPVTASDPQIEVEMSVSAGPRREATKSKTPEGGSKATPVAQPESGKHVVKKGENLWRISRDRNTLLADTIAANPDIKRPELIYPGQLINLGAPAATQAEAVPAQKPAASQELKIPTLASAVPEPTVPVKIIQRGREKEVQVSAPPAGKELVTVTVDEKKPTISHNLVGRPGADLFTAVKLAGQSGIETTRMWLGDTAPVQQDLIIPPPLETAPPPIAVPPAPPAAELAPPIVLKEVTEPTALTPNPAPAEAAPPPPAPEAPPAPPPKPSEIILLERLNLDNIPDLMVDGKVIHAKDTKNFVTDLIRDHHFCDRCAADYAGNIYWESAGDPNAVGDNGRSRGLIMAQGDRQNGMPSDFHDQLHWTFEDIRRSRNPGFMNHLQTTSPHSAEAAETIERRRLFQEWERWGKEGRRWEIADIIFSAMHNQPLPESSHIFRPGATPTFRAAAVPAPQVRDEVKSASQPAPAPEAAPANPPVAAAQIAGNSVELRLPEEDRSETIINWATKRAESNGITTVVVGEGFRVNVNIAENVEALINAAKADNVDLWAGDTFRTRGDQADRRRTNGCSDLHSSSRRAGCDIPTAPVGDSEHEDGEAIDFAVLVLNNGQPIRESDGQLKMRSLTSRDREFHWLKANAHRFGFKNLKSEAWHWSTTGR